MSEIKELIETFTSRIKSPIFGFFLFAFIGWNWDALFYLIFDTGTAERGIEYFKNNTNLYTTFWYPLLTAILGPIIMPWAILGLSWSTQKPTALINKLQLENQHKKLTEQQKLEGERDRQKTINAQRIDKELNKIEDIDIRERAKSEINNQSLSDAPKTLLLNIYKSVGVHQFEYEHIRKISPFPDNETDVCFNILEHKGYIEPREDPEFEDAYALTIQAQMLLVDEDIFKTNKPELKTLI